MGYALIKVLSKDYEIFFFTTEILQERLSKKVDKGVNWVINKENSTLIDFYKCMASEVKKNKINALLINTIEDNFSELANELKDLESKNILTLHNVNFWFNHSNWFLSDSYKKNKHKIALKKEIDAYCVLSDNVKNYLIETFNPKKPVFVFPYSIFEPQRSNELSEVSFAIPGSIDVSRRDYELVLKCFEGLHNENLKFNLFLLGAPSYKYGKSIIEKAKVLKAKGVAIEFFEKLVDQDVFDNLISKSSFILSPLQPVIREEQYGKSKETGCFFDMIRYSKPGIVPEYVPAPPQMRSSVMCYSNKESLMDLLRKIIADEKMRNDYTGRAQKNSELFSVENVRIEATRFIETLI